MKCLCGREMSEYEQTKYGSCGFCAEMEASRLFEEKQAEQKRLAEKREQERIEQERLKKQEAERKKEVHKQAFRDLLLMLKGKTIEDAYVQEWTEASGEPNPHTVVLSFTDGTEFTVCRECYADGCMGHYDYYYYLGITLSEEGQQ